MAISFAQLSSRKSRRLPVVLQTEDSECALACLIMISGFYGHFTDLGNLRREHSVSQKGATLEEVIRIAEQLALSTRPLTLEIEHLPKLRLPCILHWNFNHFVVLARVSAKEITIHDPATGLRKIGRAEFSASFTGVALELWPRPDFRVSDERISIKLSNLVGKIYGVASTFGQVLALALAIELFNIANPFFLQWVIDHVLVNADRDLLTTLVFAFACLMVVQEAVTAMRSWMLVFLSTMLSVQWRSNVLNHLLSLPVRYFERRFLGDVVSRFDSVDFIQRSLSTSFLEAILDGAMSLATLGIMLIYSVKLAAVAITAMILYGLLRTILNGPLTDVTSEKIMHGARQQNHFLETVRGIKAVKMFNRESARAAAWQALAVNQTNADIQGQKIYILFRAFNGLIFGAENIVIVWLGARTVLTGDFSVGALIAFYAYKTQFNGRVSSLIDKTLELRMLGLHGRRLAGITMEEPEPHSSADYSPRLEETSPEIEFRNVSFRYADGEPDVISEVSFKVPFGESIAIVGPSGCGKTTLVNLLLGILTPTGGEIYLSGKDVSTRGSVNARRYTGTVLQDDVLFAGSVAENISFFDPHPNREHVVKCAMQAHVDAEIDALPMQYNTLIGDMGTVFSGGQKQRILLARALYKRPRILVLDEATSHLDVRKESEVNETIRGLNLTRIVVAHRPDTIASCDRVIGFNRGQLVLDSSVASLQAASA